MSETNDDEPQGPAAPTGEDSTEGEVDLEAIAAEDGDPEEDALDMSDLDALGVEGVVARLRSTDGEDDAQVLRKSTPRRSPVVSVIVVAFGAYLLVTMFSDFRYWLRSSEPVALGHASTLLQDGRTLEAYENQYVSLEGTPDVQSVVRKTTKTKHISYLRVMEGKGGLFVAAPRPKDQPAIDNFDGHYVGRLEKLREDSAFEWLRQFYVNQQVAEIVDLDPVGTLEALDDGSLPAADGRSLEVGPGDGLRLVFTGPDARVQLDRSAFPSESDAEEAIATLGYPYLKVASVERDARSQALLGGDFHRFVVRIPADERERAKAALDALAERHGEKIGAFIFDLTAAYIAPVGQVTQEGGAIVFPYGDNTTSPGYDVQGDRLVELAKSERMSRPAAELTAVRLERVVEVDPDGFVVAVGEQPGDVWMMANLWLLVLVITGANIASLVLWRRRRAA